MERCDLMDRATHFYGLTITRPSPASHFSRKVGNVYKRKRENGGFASIAAPAVLQKFQNTLVQSFVRQGVVYGLDFRQQRWNILAHDIPKRVIIDTGVIVD